MDMLVSIILVLILGLIYWLPSIVSVARANHQTLAIIVLNTLLGWTVIGWIGALIWACMDPKRPAAMPLAASPAARQPCPKCAELVLPAAKKCPFCKSDLMQS